MSFQLCADSWRPYVGITELVFRHMSEDNQRYSSQTENSGKLSVHCSMPGSSYDNTKFKERPDSKAGGKPIALEDLTSLLPVFLCSSFSFPVSSVRSPSAFAKLSF